MRGAVILMNKERVELRDFPVPCPGPGQVVLKVMASAICGSDLRAIYRRDAAPEDPAEMYRNVICGHEPAGVVAEVGPGVVRFKQGDRVCVYHVTGCGVCRHCRQGTVISCQLARSAYGFQRDGGMGEYLLAEEQSCMPLPDELSFEDGALIACGAGTAYEALLRAGVSGDDRVFITGLGPVGLAMGMIAQKLGACQIIGVDISEERVGIAKRIGAVTDGLSAVGDEALRFVQEKTGGDLCEASFDCSGATSARTLALRGTRRWGQCTLIGMGGRLEIDVDELMVFKQLTIRSSWVTSLGHMEDLCGRAARWGLHLDKMITERLPLGEIGNAYAIANAAQSGKVCIVPD
jgi:threonine dehydrogenase-like Zn-dependent dehydrogenase